MKENSRQILVLLFDPVLYPFVYSKVVLNPFCKKPFSEIFSPVMITMQYTLRIKYLIKIGRTIFFSYFRYRKFRYWWYSKGHFTKELLGNPWNPKICTLLPYLTARKSRAEVCKFLDFMDLPSNSFVKWPLTHRSQQKSLT